MSSEKKILMLIIICVILILFPIDVFAEGVETYTVSFNSMGGSDTASIIAESGTTITKPADPSWQGHYFCGWYKEEECINDWEFDTDPVTSDITLFAAWKDLYTISASSTVSAMGEDSVAAPSASAAAGGYKSIRVSWDAVPGASGYEVWRSATLDGTYSTVYTFMSPEASRYTDYNLTADSTYYYKVRAYRTTDSVPNYSEYSDIISAQASFVTPSLNAVSASETSIRLTWDELSGVSGYELYRGISKYGRYTKIYTATSSPTIIYTNTGLINGATYYFKIRAYSREGSKKIYSRYSPTVSAVPSTTLIERTFTILYQGDPKWGFPDEVRHVACLMSSYAITINNMGIPATPRTVYESNGYSTNMNFINLATNFGVKTVCALDPCSPYLVSYTDHETYIKNPFSNATAAIKEALNKHPEGVICYFKRGDAKHAIVACKYDGDIIYYSDPGRTRTTLLTFSNTWVWYHHRMGYGNLAYIAALEEIE